ncbi:MAG: beta-phosphoglucomutase [Acholeplasmataceae bacterium]
MIKAVIFDLDGVIVSTDELHYQSWKKIADDENIYFDKIINHKLRGVSRMDSLNIILGYASKTYSEDEKINLATNKNDIYVELLKQLDQKDILPNVVETLKGLKSKGIFIAIGSSSKNAKPILRRIGLIDMFDVIADGNDIKHSKPAPDVFLVAAERLGVNPNSCMVVEDAMAGIKAAKNAKMIAVAVSEAKNSEIADYRLDNLKDLLLII